MYAIVSQATWQHEWSCRHYYNYFSDYIKIRKLWRQSLMNNSLADISIVLQWTHHEKDPKIVQNTTTDSKSK